MTRTSFEQEVLQRLSVIETILTDVRQDIEGTRHTIHGNGQPGLAQRMANAETKLEERTGSSTSRKETAGLSAIIAGAVIIVSEFAFVRLGITF